MYTIISVLCSGRVCVMIIAVFRPYSIQDVSHSTYIVFRVNAVFIVVSVCSVFKLRRVQYRFRVFRVQTSSISVSFPCVPCSGFVVFSIVSVCFVFRLRRVQYRFRVLCSGFVEFSIVSACSVFKLRRVQYRFRVFRVQASSSSLSLVFRNPVPSAEATSQLPTVCRVPRGLLPIQTESNLRFNVWWH
jgi:hypothetical protein